MCIAAELLITNCCCVVNAESVTADTRHSMYFIVICHNIHSKVRTLALNSELIAFY